jgi:hypothetical protein
VFRTGRCGKGGALPRPPKVSSICSSPSGGSVVGMHVGAHRDPFLGLYSNRWGVIPGHCVSQGTGGEWFSEQYPGMQQG